MTHTKSRFIIKFARTCMGHAIGLGVVYVAHHITYPYTLVQYVMEFGRCLAVVWLLILQKQIEFGSTALNRNLNKLYRTAICSTG